MFFSSRSESRIISDIILKLYADEVKFHHRKNKGHMIHKYYPYDIKDELKFTREEKKHLTIARIFFQQEKTLFYFRRKFRRIEKKNPTSLEFIEIKKAFDDFQSDFYEAFGDNTIESPSGVHIKPSSYDFNPDYINTTATVPLRQKNEEYDWWVEIYDEDEQYYDKLLGR